jgi:hypothetical protein
LLRRKIETALTTGAPGAYFSSRCRCISQLFTRGSLMRYGLLRGLIAALSLLSIGAAGAQDFRDVSLGDRAAGEISSVQLGARNRNCPQPLDFRFTSQSPWLRLPADPVVRQVPNGQTRFIATTIDLTGMAPGPYQGFIDVDCENCGFLIFKNCKINRETLRFNVNVVAASAAPAQPPQGGGNQGAGQNAGQVVENGADQAGAVPPIGINLDDERIPQRLRQKAKEAYDAWLAALKQLEACKAELARLRAAAAEKEAEAEKARRAAETAEQDLRNARAQEEAAKQEQKEAQKESGAAQGALAEAEAALKRGGISQADYDKAKARAEAAVKRVADANKAVGLYSKDALKAMEKDAADKRKAVKAAEKAAAAAAAAVAKKETEFAQHQADADKAEAAKDKAEKDARDSIPVVKPPTAEEIAKARKAANDCIKELAALIEAQAKAMQALASLGALPEGNTYSGLKDWADAVDKANDLFGSFSVPGAGLVSETAGIISSYAGNAAQILEAIRAAIGVWSAVEYTGNLNLAPKAGVTKSPEHTKDYLKDKGLAESDKEAGDILKQMEKFSETNSTKGFEQELADKKKMCDAMVAKAEAMEKAAAGK